MDHGWIFEEPSLLSPSSSEIGFLSPQTKSYSTYSFFLPTTTTTLQTMKFSTAAVVAATALSLSHAFVPLSNFNRQRPSVVSSQPSSILKSTTAEASETYE